MAHKFISWNIWGGKFLPEVIDFLDASDADIIALQEVEEQGEHANTAKVIAQRLGYAYVYARSMEYREGENVSFRGNAILSRFPITGSTRYEISEKPSRAAIAADITVDSTILHVLSVHLVNSQTKPVGIQSEQVKKIIEIAPKEHIVIMGDFNSTPESEPIMIMKNTFRDTDPNNTPSWCLYPEGKQERPDQVKWKYDYIFTTPDMTASDFRAGNSKGSDHLPVSVTLTL